MISPELIRRYPLFAGLSKEQITTLARAANELTAESGHYFFHEEEKLDHFYVVVEGEVGIIIDLTDHDVDQPLSGQLTGKIKTREIIVTSVKPGEMFGWSALVPPHNATSSVKALAPSRVVAFDCQKLRPILAEDCQFSHLILQKITQVIRERLRAMRIESLSDLLSHTT